MSKISELDNYKLGKLKGRCTDYPDKEHLNTSDENYRRGVKVGKKVGAKQTLDEAFTDSVRNNIKALIQQYKKTKDSKVYNAIIEQYNGYIKSKGVSDSAKRELKQLIAQYRKTKDSKLFNDIVVKYQSINNKQVIKDDDDDDFVLMESEDGDYVIGKRFLKNDLKEAKEYLESNEDKKIVGQDEDGNVIVTNKDNNDTSEKEVIEEKELFDDLKK